MRSSLLTDLLRVRALTCERGGRPLFSELDLTLAPGDCVALKGPNGSGKTTLLRTLAGLFVDYEGDISIQPYAYLGHSSGLSLSLTAYENLAWYAGLAGGAASRIIDCLGQLGVGPLAHTLCKSLSAGQLRRVALARMLLLERAVWLLDEPYTALDELGCELVDQVLTQHCDGGGAVLLSTHQHVPVVRQTIRLGAD